MPGTMWCTVNSNLFHKRSPIAVIVIAIKKSFAILCMKKIFAIRTRIIPVFIVRQELPDSQTIACECPNCGARVIVKEHEVAETCIFCQSKVLRSDVQMGEGFPEMLIPFKLNRKQAEKRLDEWIEQHHDKSEAQILKENKKKLKGIYLPYELIRGPIRFVVTRDNSNRYYECGGFLEHVAVNVTDRCNNLLLNGKEPFLWDVIICILCFFQIAGTQILSHHNADAGTKL